ncbi:MAG: hypothetical protein ACLTDR_03675 [Adlercreutzia equolifaciens]
MRTRVIRYAFVIYRNSFAEQDGIDNADLSAMEVAYLDCSPWRVIALKLANARDAAQVHPRNALHRRDPRALDWRGAWSTFLSRAFLRSPLSRSRRSLVRAAFVEGGWGVQQSGLPKRLVDRESEQNEREEADVHKLSDIMAVMGLAVVFVGIAMFIACWG